MKPLDCLKISGLILLPITIGVSVAEIALNFGNISFVLMLLLTIAVNIWVWNWLWRHRKEEERFLQERVNLMTAAIEQRKACLVEAVKSQSLKDIEQKTFEEIQAYIGLGLFSFDEAEQIFSLFFDAWESAPKKAAASNPCFYLNVARRLPLYR